MDGRKEAWLANALDTVFRRDTNTKNRYQRQSREAIMGGYTNRAFDSFEILMPAVEFGQVSMNYFELLRSITYFANDEGETADLEPMQVRGTRALLESIFEIAILELFDAPKHIRQEFVKVVNWSDLTDKLDQINLLCAYVGGIFSCIYQKYPKSIEELGPARQCIEKYVNANCRKMAIESLLQHKYLTKEEADNELNIASHKIENFFKSPAGIATTALLSASAMAAIGVGIYKLVTFFMNPNRDEEEEKPRPSRGYHGPG